MIYMIVPVLVAFLVGILRGGRVRNLAGLSIQFAWLPLIMIALQVSFVLFPQGEDALFFSLRPWVNSLTYVLLIVFLVVNHRPPGLKLILLGAALNLAVILANGGFMPVTVEALERSNHLDLVVHYDGQAYVAGSKDIVQRGEETRLAVLSDVISTPDGLPSQATMSPGDILIMTGGAWMTYQAVLGQPERRRKTALPIPEVLRNPE